MIHVIATAELQPGKREEFLAAFKELRPKVQAEDGCLEYGATVDLATTLPAQSAVRDDAVTIVEKWESIAALEAHLIAPHMTEYRTGIKDLVKGITLQVLEPA